MEAAPVHPREPAKERMPSQSLINVSISLAAQSLSSPRPFSPWQVVSSFSSTECFSSYLLFIHCLIIKNGKSLNQMVCNNRLLKNRSPRVSVKTTNLARDLESGKGPNGRQQVKNLSFLTQCGNIYLVVYMYIGSGLQLYTFSELIKCHEIPGLIIFCLS